MSNDRNAYLRSKAEQVLEAKHPDLKNYSIAEFEALVHELQVHQIELELQNEELRRTQSELETSRHQYADLFNYAPIGYFILDSNKQITQVNTTGAQMLQIPRERLANSFFFRIVAEADREKLLILFNRLIETRASQSFEVQLVKADGTIFDAQLECMRTQLDGSDINRIALIDITDRKRAEKQAFELATEKENVRILAEFLADASHDLRTPITVIMSTLYLLEAKEPLSEQQDHYIQSVKGQVARLTSLIENMLHMSELDVHNVYRHEQVDVVALLREIVQDFEPIAEVRQLSLAILHDANSIVASIDRYHIYHAIGNLFNNAIAYSPVDAQIIANVYSKNENVVIEIKDHGVGISQDDLPHIFERFYRSDKSRNSQTGGSGLGLSIVQKVVTGHQGQIEVESELGIGSTFRVILPQR